MSSPSGDSTAPEDRHQGKLGVLVSASSYERHDLGTLGPREDVRHQERDELKIEVALSNLRVEMATYQAFMRLSHERTFTKSVHAS